MDEMKLGYVFGQGICQNQNTIRVISHFDELANYGSSTSNLMMLNLKKNQWHHYNLGWKAIRIACSSSQMFTLGQSGKLLRADAGGVQEEFISGKPEVTLDGLRDMRLIGDHIYVVGTGGQVKKRVSKDQWIDFMDGLQNRGEVAFNAVHGLDESDIYAVGDSGKIHRCVDGKWQEIESPVAANLENLLVTEKGVAYATSLDGVLLHIKENSVEIVAQDETLKTLLGIATLNGKLYFATEKQILTFGVGQKLEDVHVANGPTWTFGRLHANDGMLWSFGKNHLFFTEDGERWNNATPRATYFDPAESGPSVSQSSSSCCTGGGHKCS